MSHIFISHSHKDAKHADRIRKILEKVNRVGWVAQHSISPAEPWAETIDDALRSAAAVVVVVTPNARNSEYVTYEWSFALGAGKPVVPLFVEKTEQHPRLDAKHGVDFTGGWKSWPRLVEKLLDHLPQPGTRAAATTGRGDPALLAEFDCRSGRFIRRGAEYKIWLWVENVPPEPGDEVEYEILYPGFKDNPWRESLGKGNYRTWISSYGNVPITADGQHDRGAWFAGAFLYDALRRHYGNNPPAAIAKAIEIIRNN